MLPYVLALDQGTTSSRAILYDAEGQEVSMAQTLFAQHYPRPGWVEHDPNEIWETQVRSAREAMERAAIKASDIAAIGIANQRETCVFWDRRTGTPMGRAIVWQDRRTADMCRALSGQESDITERTGLLLDPYFSGTKIAWFLQNIPGAREKAMAGELCFGTVDSWLIRRMTGRHLTDPSNASRTLLFNIHTGEWDTDMLELFGVPRKILPEVVPSASDFGMASQEIFGADIPVRGCLGDQQAALLGQACLSPGMVKATYGTGCFVLVGTGNRAVSSQNRLLTTIAWDLGAGMEYAVEGSVFIGGAVLQWLRDELSILSASRDSERIARSVPDTAGVYFVPALVGLGAPYWDADARGAVFGITRGTRREHIVRAALESIAFQTRDLIEAMEKDAGSRISAVRVDGGASVNGFLMQFQSDILGAPLVRPRSPETTALGAAFAAGLAAGVWSDKEQLTRIWREEISFRPAMPEEERTARIKAWKRAVAAARAFGKEE